MQSRLIDDLYTLPFGLVEGESYATVKGELLHELSQICPGVKQITLHPCLYSNESRPLTRQKEKREMEYRLFHDPDIQQCIEREQVRLISWKDIRDMQRSGERFL